jgi:HPt (histidine-containing phosphotransfer) domain-containing protein
MTEAIQEFVANLPQRVATVNQLLAERNFSELQRVMHQIQGAAGGYGFDELTQLAGEVERALGQGDPLESIEARAASLIALVRRIDGYQPAQELNHDKEDSRN